MNRVQNPYDRLFDANRQVTAEQVRDSRRRLRLAETELRLKKLQTVRRLVENATSADYWVSVVNDRLDRFRTDPTVYATTNYFDRRAGRNVPLFQSERELGLLRMQGRILCATNSYAIGLCEGLTSYVIGTGYTYRTASRHRERPAPPELLAAVQDIIDDFQERNEWYGGEQPGFEEELFWRSVEDGEFIVCATRTLEGDTDLRSVEPDQLTQRPGSNFEEYSFGIRTEPDDVQRPLAYWIFFGLNPADGDEYGPDQITHYRRNAKRSIKRGLTDFCFDTLDALSLASKLRRNMSLGAAIQACYAGIRQHETATQGEVEGMQELMSDYTLTNPVSGRSEHYQKHEPGMVDIPKGMTFATPPTATNAAAHVEILGACLRGAGIRWNAPEWIASADASNNNYASSLTAESPFVKTVVRRQHGYQETFRRLHWTAVENKIRARGELRVRRAVLDSNGEPTGAYGEESYSWEQVKRLVEIQVEAPSPETRNKLEEAQTNQIYLMSQVKSPQTVQQELGLDPEEEAVNQEEWRERTGGAGAGLGLPEDPGRMPVTVLPEGLQESLRLTEEPPPINNDDDLPPDAVALPIPDIRQNTDFSCGCAALKAVLEFFGVSKPEEDIRKGTGTESLTGTHQEELAEYAQSCGLKADVREGMTADDLTQQLAAGRPVIALVYAHGTGHYVVVCGIADGDVNLQDPATGPGLMPLQEFMERWVWVGGDNQMARRVGVVVGK